MREGSPRGRFQRALGRAIAWLGVAGLGMSVAGCRTWSVLPPPQAAQAGPLRIGVVVPAEATVDSRTQASLQVVRVTLAKDAYAFVQEQPLASTCPAGGCVHDFVFERVYEGTWDVVAQVIDGDGDTVYAGEARVTVLAGESAEADIHVVACPAILRVQVDLGGYADEPLITEAGVSVRSGTASTLRGARPGRALSWSFDRERQAGTYDLQVLLYRGDGKVQLSSPWKQGVALLPGKLVTVTWQPATGTLRVGAWVDLVPAPPAPVTCTSLPDRKALAVAWTPSGEPDVERYRIYVRSPGDGYVTLEMEALPPTREADVTPDGLPWLEGGTVYVGVSAVDAAGQESLHAPGTCTLPGQSVALARP